MSQSKIIDYAEVIQRLKNDFGFKNVTQKFMSGGVCPSCKKKELFTDAHEPKGIKCSRSSNCGHYETIRDLYPDIFENLTQKVPATEEDPNATAKAYLNHLRGFDLAKINGWYEQGLFYNVETDSTTATVRFFLDKDKTRYWERLIDFSKSQFSAKAHFAGKRKLGGDFYKGDWWQPPGAMNDPGRPLYLVEGIFDAISFEHCGFQARSLMSCNNFPLNMLKGLDKSQVLIFALDNNKAGREYAIKHVARAKDMGFTAYAAFPESEQLDWNDLYKKEGIDRFANVLDRALWHGAIISANNAQQSAALMVAHTRKHYRIIEKNNAYWEAKYDQQKLEKMIGDPEDPELLNSYFKRDTFDLLTDEIFLSQIKSCIKMTSISNCTINFEYQQVDQYTKERYYHFNICYQNSDMTTPIDLTGSAISSSSELNKSLLNSTAGATFLGGKKHLEFLHLNTWFKKQPKIVNTIDFVGYDKTHEIYVFSDVALKEKHRIPVNKQGYFSHKDIAIKSTMKLEDQITLSSIDSFDANKFCYHLQNAFFDKGLIVLAWWVGSLFATQIRDKIGHYPFFEWVGDGSSGKSSLIEILWKLYGRDHEGFNPFTTKIVGVTRKMSEVSNMPVVFLESDANDERGGNAMGFNWELLKAAHDGKGIRSRGVKNNGNETITPPFRGTLMATHNNPIKASEATMSRFVHLHWGKLDHRANSGEHADILRYQDKSQTSGFLPMIIQHEKQIIKTSLEQQAEFAAVIKSIGVTNPRIIKNHALIMGILVGIGKVLPLDNHIIDNAIERLTMMAKERQLSTLQDHPSVEEFWDAYDYLNIHQDGLLTQTILNHSCNPEVIAINLVHFEKVCKERGVNPPDKRELKRHIQGNKRHKYISHKSIRSKITNKTISCYLFEKKN